MLISTLFLLITGTQTFAQTYSLEGFVYDDDTRKPVNYASIFIPETNQLATTDALGFFKFDEELLKGNYQVLISHISYIDTSLSISLTNSKPKIIYLKSEIFKSETVIVEGKYEDNALIVGKADKKFTAKALRDKISITLAETLSGELGITQRSMGPAPARPIIRGLGGDRLLILEDGARTGDLSATSNDHAVVLDPTNAKEIEIFRGPEAIQFGSNTLGGVINVWNKNILSSQIEQSTLNASIAAESVNEGYSTGIDYAVPLNNFALTTSLSFRNASNTQTPIGALQNTELQSGRLSLGGSYFYNNGFFGASVSYLENNYGIPGGFVGAHPNGVNIELQRTQFEIRNSTYLNRWGIDHLEFQYNFTEYYHQEYESNDLLGVEFGVLTTGVQLNAHSHETKFGTYTVGTWFQLRDYANGGFVFTPNTIENTLAGYLYHDFKWKTWNIESAIRYDFKTVNPLINESQSVVGTISDRIFHSWSGALEFSKDFKQQNVGLRFMRTFRAPGLEELFSEGPHLAAYSFEIGNSNNDIEVGINTEIFTKLNFGPIQSEASLYLNQISGYLFPQDIDSLHPGQLLPIFQFQGRDATFWGYEFESVYQINSAISLKGSLSYTEATFNEDNNPVPFIPPLFGQFHISYLSNDWSLNTFIQFSDNQDRLGIFEEPTDGYYSLGFSFEKRIKLGKSLHIFNLRGTNLLDMTYRNHLSRVKSIMPEPGRNIRLLYKFYF